MRITFMGHACFLLETAGNIKIVTDPYEPGSYQGALRYAPIAIAADIVTVSHQHPDHNFIKEFRKAQVYNQVGHWSLSGINIQGVPSYHDRESGALRGNNIIFVISADGLRIAHFGDIGTVDIDYDALGQIDIAFIPVGTVFTIDNAEIEKLCKALKPKICIPMHFKTPRCQFDIATVDDFIAGKPNVQHCAAIDISPDTISSFHPIVVLTSMR